MTDPDFYWLVGLLEGEGCFHTFLGGTRYQKMVCTVVVRISMTDEDVVARAASILGINYTHGTGAKARYKPVFHATVCGKKAILLMDRLLPHMGNRRQAQIRTAIEKYNDRPLAQSPRKARKLTPILVHQIRASTGSARSTGKRFGVSGHMIRAIRDGTWWKPLCEDNQYLLELNTWL